MSEASEMSETREGNSIHSEVEVAVDAATAFQIFTEEVDCWWLQGPINFHDTSRALYHYFEPRVGGRLMEVYDANSGTGLELGHITAWQPGERLAWDSAIDDVQVEIRFTPSGSGTRVQVRATIADGGEDRGTTSWVRMMPAWLPRWFDRRDTVPHKPLQMTALAVALYYDKPATAARWLRDVFRLDLASGIPDEDTKDEYTWIEFHVGVPEAMSSVIVMPRAEHNAGAEPTHGIWVFVDDLDGLHAHASASGAEPGEIWQHGPRAFDVTDIEGYRWTFAQARPVSGSA